jgi:hypothetical protein
LIYNEFGATGKKVSAIGFGGMRFKASEYNKDIGICAELVLEAYKKGITYFDTGPGYCDDQSEAIMGEAFKQMKYGDFYVSTKCGLWHTTSASGVREMIEKSLKILNVPKITFYNMWCIKSMDDYRKMTAKGGMYDGMLKAKEEGLIEHICCTTHVNGEENATIVKDGLVECITLPYNAINFAYRRRGIVACHAAGKGVVVMNPLGGGIIPQYPNNFSFLKEGSADSLAVAALKFLVSHKEIAVTLPGISSLDELNEALLSTENLPQVDEAYLENLSKKLNIEMDTLCTCCSYCDQCPENIPVNKLIEAYNETILSGGDDMQGTFDRLRMHWGVSAETAKACTACGKCETLCTQKLPIMERLNKMVSGI